ncbi:leucine-rich repeat protein [Tanacetum coccineum]
MSHTYCVCLLTLVTLFHLCLSSRNLENVLCIDVERQALLEFKHGLIDEADGLASWAGEKSDCCRWAGIACNNVTGHVRRIHLPGANGHCVSYDGQGTKQRLRGNLSSSLLHLKQLRHLDLSCNDFGGIQVPTFIGSLGNLRYLNLSRSEFSGIIPPQLGNLSKLHFLGLGSFHEMYIFPLTSMINMQWLSSLRLLRHLDMSGVDLSLATDWLQVINTLPSLIELHLSSCRLSHIHSDVHSLNLTSLSVLDLSYNYFNTPVAQWIFSITSLVSLDLSICSFHSLNSSSNIYNFRNLTSLEMLHVRGNAFMNSTLVLKELSSVSSNLISLDISSCGISSSVLDSLHNLTSLLSLDMSGNQLTKKLPKSFCNFCNLKEIELSNNNFFNTSLTYLLESFFECKSPSLESFSIYESGLSGLLPSQLGQLVHLEYLQLSHNNIAGTIPDSIKRLSLLRTLDLRENVICGPIPHSIGRLSSLEMLHLSNNQLNGSLPNSIGQLSSLKELHFSQNELDGSLPRSLGQLSKLEKLSFSYNFLTGVVTEAHFAKLVSLNYLNGKGNNLTLRLQVEDWIPPFRIQYLHLNSWGLGPQFPLWLHSQRDLRELDISNTHIYSPLPESFWRSFPNLTFLDMSKNHIQGTLSGIPATLRLVDLSSNRLTGKLPNLLNGSVLLLLDLSDNLFAGSLDSLLCSNGVKGTTTLNLGDNNLSGVIPDCWEKWPALTFLNLENNNLFGEIPGTLGSIPYLQSLNMRGNKISGPLPASLMKLRILKVLQLGRNELVGSIPTWFGRKLSSLRVLNLRSNKLNGNIPPEFCSLKFIQILDLADNKLSGNIPRCIYNFTVLSGKENTSDNPFMFNSLNSQGKSITNSDSLVMKGREDTYNTLLRLVLLLDFSNNNFSGNIPSELTALLKLQSLNFSGNGLSGRIPGNIGDMKSLQTLDLSLNRLSGELPMSLSNLSFLSSFNVSFNNLTGRVPFFGNNLCGAPLTKPCGVKVPDMQDPKEDDNGSHETNWGLIISIVLGFVTSFWTVLAPLIICRSWRTTYFRYLNVMRYKIYDVMHKYFWN